MTRATHNVLLAVTSAITDSEEALRDTEKAATSSVASLDAFLSRLAPVDRWRLRALLQGVEWLGPVSRGRPRRFSRLPLRERQALLDGWSKSNVAPFRQMVAVLRSLAMIARYGREEAWEAIGYDGPWLGRVEVPALPVPEFAGPDTMTVGEVGARERRTVGGRTGAGQSAGSWPDTRGWVSGGRGEGAPLRAQVCVIGLGAGGAAVTARLAELGLDVIAIEAGGERIAADFDQRELSMLPLLYREAGLRATADTAIGILQGEGVGGSTLHNTGLVHAPPAGIIARWRAEHGFAFDDLEFRGHVETVFGALRATPVPESEINRANDILRRGAERLGWRHSVTRHNRAPCSGCGYCMLGCAYNRKWNAAFAFVPTARAHGARIVSGARAIRIEGAAGRRRVVCERLDTERRPTGARFHVEAAVVVLAAGALDSPALLLRSGLGNARVGRGLRLHPAAAVTAAFPDPVIAWRGVPQSVIIEEFAEYLHAGRGGFLFLPNAATSPALTAVLTPGLGAEHRRRMLAYPRMAAASVLLHDETEGRVVTGRGGRPVARYWPGESDRAELRRGVEALARLYLAAGAESVLLPFTGARPVADEAALTREVERAKVRRFTLPLNSVHPQASCGLGADPDRSAVDPRGEVRGAPGVYVCDASIFPTSVGVPPQVTIMALARAVADRIREEFS